MVDEDWSRLVAFVIKDRVEAGFETQQQFANALGLNVKSVGNFERGQHRMRRATLSRVETLLNWAPGSTQTVLRGGEPTYLDQLPPPRTEADLRDEVERKMWEIGKEGDLPEHRIWLRIDQLRMVRAKKARAEEERRGRGTA